MPDSYDHITVMEGSGLSGLRKYWFGFHEEPIQRLSTEGVETVAKPVGHYELPRPMTSPEIEEWALDHLDVDEAAIEQARVNGQTDGVETGNKRGRGK